MILKGIFMRFFKKLRYLKDICRIYDIYVKYGYSVYGGVAF